MENNTYTTEQLSNQYGCEIISFELQNGEESAIGYMKKLKLDMKLRRIDAYSNGNTATVASSMLETHLLKESDPRISKTNDDWWIGAVSIVIKTIEQAKGEIKKK